MSEVQDMEKAMSKCFEIAQFAIEKYDDLFNKQQHLIIEYEDAQQNFTIQ